MQKFVLKSIILKQINKKYSGNYIFSIKTRLIKVEEKKIRKLWKRISLGIYLDKLIKICI